MWHHCIKMEFEKIVNFFDTICDDKDLPSFVTKTWIDFFDQSGGNYNVNKEIRIKASMLKPDLCDFSDAYIVVKRTITAANPNNAIRNKAVAFKNNAPFINCISKSNGVKIDTAEDSDVVMPITIYSNTVKIIEKQQVGCRIIIKINQVILLLLILNILNVKKLLQETLTILLLVKLVMMQLKLEKMKLEFLFHQNI